MALRILASVVILISVLFLPFWVSVVLAFIGMLFFHIFWEAVVLLFLSDLLYGIKEEKFFGITFISSVLAVLLLMLVEFLKKKLKFYR